MKSMDEIGLNSDNQIDISKKKKKAVHCLKNCGKLLSRQV